MVSLHSIYIKSINFNYHLQIVLKYNKMPFCAPMTYPLECSSFNSWTRSLLFLGPLTGDQECLLGVGGGAGGDVEVEQEPGGQHPQREDGVHLVTVDVAVHYAEHHSVLPRLQQPHT